MTFPNRGGLPFLIEIQANFFRSPRSELAAADVPSAATAAAGAGGGLLGPALSADGVVEEQVAGAGQLHAAGGCVFPGAGLAPDGLKLAAHDPGSFVLSRTAILFTPLGRAFMKYLAENGL